MGNITCCFHNDAIIQPKQSERFTSVDIAEEMNGYSSVGDTFINLIFTLTLSPPKIDYTHIKYTIHYVFQSLEWVEEKKTLDQSVVSKSFGVYYVLQDNDKVFIFLV